MVLRASLELRDQRLNRCHDGHALSCKAHGKETWRALRKLQTKPSFAQIFREAQKI